MRRPPEIRRALAIIAQCLLLTSSAAGRSPRAVPGDDPESSPLMCVLVAAEATPAGSGREWGLTRTGEAYLRLGKVEFAFRALHAQSPRDRLLSAVCLAHVAKDAGLRAAALRFADEAMRIGANDDPDPRTVAAIADITVAITVALGDLDRTVAVANLLATLDDETRAANVLVRAADAYARAGSVARALEVLTRAAAIVEPDDMATGIENLDRIEQLGNLASVYARLGDTARVDKLLSVATTAAEREREFYKERAARDLAMAHIAAGRQGDALRIAASMDDSSKIDVVLAVAAACAERGMGGKAHDLLLEAERLAEPTRNTYDGAQPRRELVTIYLRLAMPDAATRLLGEISDSYNLTEASVEIADWAREHDRSDIADRVLDSAVVRLSAIVSEKNSEISPYSSTSNAREKASALGVVASACVRAGRLDRALAAAAAIDLPQWRADVLADVAGATMRAGSKAGAREILDRARRLSTSTPDHSHDRYAPLTQSNLALRFAEIGDEAQALALFARALELPDSYSDPLTFIAHIGYGFEKSGVKADRRIRTLLRKVRREYH